MSDDSFADFRQADGRFATGNPDGPGRPRARDQMAALEQRVAEASDESIEAALTAAKAGNVKAIEMLLNRIWPARAAGRSRSRRPKIRGTSDLVPATAAIVNAVLNGDVTPREGAAAARMIQAHGSVITWSTSNSACWSSKRKAHVSEQSDGEDAVFQPFKLRFRPFIGDQDYRKMQ